MECHKGFEHCSNNVFDRVVIFSPPDFNKEFVAQVGFSQLVRFHIAHSFWTELEVAETDISQELFVVSVSLLHYVVFFFVKEKFGDDWDSP